jgi:hypothetical protein
MRSSHRQAKRRQVGALQKEALRRQVCSDLLRVLMEFPWCKLPLCSVQAAAGGAGEEGEGVRQNRGDDGEAFAHGFG